MQDEHTSEEQGGGAIEAATSVDHSRQVAERLWAEIGRLLADSRSVARPSGISERQAGR
jgi:hypothetical protein